MVAITRDLAAVPTRAARPTRASPELDAKLRNCRAEMADWVTCPSAKTPEGKAKIARIAAQLESVKQQIKQSDPTSASTSTSRPVQRPDRAGEAADPTAADAANGGSTEARIGAHLDLYA